MAAPGKPEYRKALGRFATGITVITADRDDGGIHGMTANAFASVSLVPPQILICVDERAAMLPRLTAATRFGVTILGENQQAFSDYFARGQQDEAEAERLGIRFRRSEFGTPLLVSGLATLDCRKVAAHIAGDHTVFIGEVEDLAWAEGNPLLYFAGQYRKL
jgi:flavin reductase (DIM6/NTAB) family NADH-FMN oxidoreductase RutF